MKNPQNGEFYILVYKGDTLFITITRSLRGVVRAWHGYSDAVLAIAKGFGYNYNKESQVLATACSDFMRKHGASDSDVKSVHNTHTTGVYNIKAAIAKAGGRLCDRHDAISLIHNDIKSKGYYETLRGTNKQ